MNDRSVDKLLSELTTALDVTPSAGFAAGVRARIAEKQTPRGWTRWWPFAAGAMIAASAAIAVVLRSPAPGERVVDRPATVTSAAPVQTAPSAVAPPVTPTWPAARPVRHVAQPVAPEAVRASAAEPALEVITDQGAVLRNLWARAGSRGAVKEVDSAAANDATIDPTKEIVLPKVTIDPIVINALGGDGAAPAAPTMDRTTIRRAQAGRE